MDLRPAIGAANPNPAQPGAANAASNKLTDQVVAYIASQGMIGCDFAMLRAAFPETEPKILGTVAASATKKAQLLEKRGERWYATAKATGGNGGGTRQQQSEHAQHQPHAAD